jgi:hypothetical protein
MFETSKILGRKRESEGEWRQYRGRRGHNNNSNTFFTAPLLRRIFSLASALMQTSSQLQEASLWYSTPADNETCAVFGLVSFLLLSDWSTF